MSVFDTILLFILAGFIFYGLFFGLIRTIGAFLGVIVAAFLASHFYLMIAQWLTPFFFGYNNLGKVLVFIFLFALVNRLVGFLFYLLDKTFNFFAIIPFLKTFNRLGGALLGFITGSLSIGLVLYVASRYAILHHWFGNTLESSQLAPFFLKFATLLLPLLPEVLKKIKSLI